MYIYAVHMYTLRNNTREIWTGYNTFKANNCMHCHQFTWALHHLLLEILFFRLSLIYYKKKIIIFDLLAKLLCFQYIFIVVLFSTTLCTHQSVIRLPVSSTTHLIFKRFISVVCLRTCSNEYIIMCLINFTLCIALHMFPL